MEGRKVVQFRDLQDAAIKSATVMEIAAVIIEKTLAYLTKLSGEMESIFTASFPD